MKSLYKTVALITIFSIITRILGFIFRIILSRVVGAEGLGLYQVAFSVFMVLLTIIASGIPLIISRINAKYIAKKEYKKSKSFISVSLVYTLLLSLILCAIVLICKNLFAKMFPVERCIEILIVLLPGLVFSSVYSVLRGAMWSENNYFALCITELYEQVVHIVVGVLLIDFTFSAIDNAVNLAWSMSIACFFSMLLVVLLYFYYGGKLGKYKKGYLRPLIKQSSSITFMRVSGSFIQPLIAFIIPLRLIAIGYTKSQALSMFGVAVGMTIPLLFIPTTIIGSLSTALIPNISTALTENKSDYIKSKVKESVLFAMIISSLFIPVFLGMGENIGVFLFDNVLSGTLLVASAWVLIPLGLTNITSGILNSLGLEGKSFINFAIGAVVMFIALWILPPYFGINSIIWSMGINYIIIALLNILLIKRKLKIKLNILPCLTKLLLVILPTSALTAFVSNLGNYVFPMIINLLFSGSVCVGVFILMLGVLNIVNIKGFIISIKDKTKFFKRKRKAI